MPVQYPVLSLRTYLAARLGETVSVATQVPADWPSHVSVGGQRRRLVVIGTAPAGATDKPEHLSWRRFVIHVYDTGGELPTADLAENVRKIVLASRYAGIGFRKLVPVGEPANFPDPDTDTPRFQLTVDALTRVVYT